MHLPDPHTRPAIDVLVADAAYAMTKDARVVGIRWDLVEWGLVFDLDCPASEARDSPCSRGWLIFRNVAEMSLPLTGRVRLPSGIWITSELRSDGAAGVNTYAFEMLAPEFGPDEQLARSPTHTASVRAEVVVGLRTREHGQPGPTGLAYEARQRLASDELLRAVAAEAVAGIPRPR